MLAPRVIATVAVQLSTMMHSEPPDSPHSDASDASSSWEMVQTTPEDPISPSRTADEASTDGSDVSEGPEGRVMRLYAPSEDDESVLGTAVIPEALTTEATGMAEAAGEVPHGCYFIFDSHMYSFAFQASLGRMLVRGCDRGVTVCPWYGPTQAMEVNELPWHASICLSSLQSPRLS